MNENKRKIGIISIEPQTFTNRETGVVSDMLKITYLTKINKENEHFYGSNVLVSYIPNRNIDIEKLRKYLIVPTSDASIEERVSDNRIKFVINTINELHLR